MIPSDDDDPPTLRNGAPDGAVAPRILFVDDDPDQRDAVGELLRAEGYDVTTACDGADALTVLGDTGQAPNAILTDLMMPVMSGWELIEELGRNPSWSEIPIVVLSGTPEHVRLDAARVVIQLRKPADVSLLLRGVERACIAAAR